MSTVITVHDTERLVTKLWLLVQGEPDRSFECTTCRLELPHADVYNIETRRYFAKHVQFDHVVPTGIIAVDRSLVTRD